jgi:uncharacterized protein YndB with AHSA1/START domain
MYDIVHRIGINAKPEAVFAALTTLAGVRGWWVSTATGNSEQGGTIDFGFCEMKVLHAEPGRLVHWQCTRGPSEWVGTEVTFRLEWKDEQTFVLFKHANWKDQVEFMYHCSMKWATFLLSLTELVERGSGRPAPHDVKIHVRD